MLYSQALNLLLFSFALCARSLDNGLAVRPGIGWNSDYCTACSHVDATGRLRPGVTGFQNEAFIKHIADFVNSSGLQALGYSNINMDSLWDLPTRDANGDLQPDPALWPSGFNYIVDYVHSRGLGFGVYGDRGNLDCNRNPGQLGHEEQDAAFFARHGIDVRLTPLRSRAGAFLVFARNFLTPATPCTPVV
jgi:alpha-galactosidase